MRRLALPGLLALMAWSVAGAAAASAEKGVAGVAPTASSQALPAVSAAPSSRSPERRLAEALRFRTISHQDPAQLDPEPFRALHAYLAQAFPRVHATLERERVSELSLLYRWPGRDPEAPAVLLTAHLDVVPVPEDQRAAWTHPPFEGVIAEGFVWGRGAIDDKGGVLAILEAVEGLLAEGFEPEGTLYLAFGHDEEVGGEEGAGAITELLASRGVRVAYSLDEGMAILDGSILGVDVPLAAVGIAEKGYVTLRLHCSAPGGHSSTPPPESALGCLARAILRLEENPFPPHLDGVAGRTLSALAPQLSLPARVAVQAPWLFGPLLVSRLDGSPATRAMLRTTTAVTMAEAGVKENVLPSRAHATVNFRVSPAEDGAFVRQRVAELLADLPVEIETLRVTEPSQVSSTESAAWRDLVRAIGAVAPRAVVVPGLVLGGTDSKHYARVADDSYRFTPFRLGPEDVARIHGVDERVAVANYHELIRFYRELLRGPAG